MENISTNFALSVNQCLLEDLPSAFNLEISINNDNLINKVISQREIFIALDISGSMSGDPIKHTKKSLKKFIKTMYQICLTDISLLIFNHECEYKNFKNTSLDKINKYIDKIKVDGGTDFKKVLNCIKDHIKDKSNLIIIFFTDGKDGYKVYSIDEEKVALINTYDIDKRSLLIKKTIDDLANEIKAKTLSTEVHCIGFSEESDSKVLTQICKIGTMPGSYQHIENSELINNAIDNITKMIFDNILSVEIISAEFEQEL